MKNLFWISISLLVSLSAHAELSPPNSQLQLWPYLENAAIQEEDSRDSDGISYLIGGTVALALPFLISQPGSPIRTALNITLIPTGSISVIYGGFLLLTDSSWTNMKRKVTHLSGPRPAQDSHDPSFELAQWELRRETHTRELFLKRADHTRFWRFFWGSVEAGSAFILLKNNPSAVGISTATVLAGLSVYHFAYRQWEERMADDILKTSENNFLPSVFQDPTGGAGFLLSIQTKF